jgi:molybdate transport system substrate-binding protein
MRRALVAAMAALLVPLAGTSVARAETLRVFAASSLTEAFQEAAAAFEAAHAGDHVELNLAGSQLLRMQIEQGAAADVFASADRAHADALRQSRLLPTYQIFARNGLVVVASPEGPVRRLQDIAGPRVKVVMGGEAVPVGRYALQALGRLAASGLFGDDFQARVLANVVSQEPNVRAVLSKVALGEADVGFVYETDAAGDEKVRRIEIPERYNVSAEYPIGVLSASRAREQAQAFVDFVLAPAGRAILRKHGFRTE